MKTKIEKADNRSKVWKSHFDQKWNQLYNQLDDAAKSQVLTAPDGAASGDLARLACEYADKIMGVN